MTSSLTIARLPSHMHRVRVLERPRIECVPPSPLSPEREPEFRPDVCSAIIHETLSAKFVRALCKETEMIRSTARSLSIVAALAAAAAPAHATPSTTMWAPATPALQGERVLHLTYDTYFATDALYPVDLGLTMGVLPWQELQLEVGVDVFYPTVAADGGMEVPIYLNGKLGAPEDTYFPWQPAWSFGIYNAGFEEDVTDYNILYGVLGKTVGSLGFVAVGGYYGLNDELLVDVDGEAAQAGLLASYSSPPIDLPLVDKLALVADLQTGKSAVGAAGAGAAIYFTPSVALLTGPVFFFEPDLQPGGNSWMWSMQLDVDLDLKPAQETTPQETTP